MLDGFRRRVISSVWKDYSEEDRHAHLDDKMALGVLLWVVAEADGRFLPQEEEQMKEIIKKYAGISDKQIPVVMESAKLAAAERIDLYTFTSEVAQGLEYTAKVSVIEGLFRLGCADGELSDEEVEAIRKIAGLFHVSHKDFIDAKIRAKKQFGLKVGGEE